MTKNPKPEEAFKVCSSAVFRLRAEPVAERKRRLLSLRKWILAHRARIHEAVWADFRKPAMETDVTEVFHVLNEIRVAVRSLKRWTAPRKVDAPFFLPGSRSWVQCEPRGVCLIISPWNYPFSLAVGPLVSALAAGNSAILKPSELTPSVSALLSAMCSEIFDPAVVAVCEGDATVSQSLLAMPFDHIFFTGSPAVGKVVMRAAAENLASVTLELGGKSPAIVASDADIESAAERIALGKFLNNGQTCIAPDYVLADEAIAEKLAQAIAGETMKLYGPDRDIRHSDDYGRIVNDKHFTRVDALIEDALAKGAKAVLSGDRHKPSRFIHPVVLTEVHPESRLMNEEIFGPVLPLLTYRTLDQAIKHIHSKPKPLALYIFTRNKTSRNQILQQVSAGTVCVNDIGVQFLHHHLPFGGVNNSGMGKSHGYYGFLAFSNEKAVLKQRGGITVVKAFYPPFTARTRRIMEWVLKLF